MHTNSSKRSPGILLLLFSSRVLRVLSGVAIGMILVFLLPLAIPFVEDATTFGYVRSALMTEQVITAAVKQSIPTKIAGKDMSRWIIIAGLFTASSILGSAGSRMHEKAQYLMFRKNLDEWKAQMHISDNAVLLSPLNQKLEQFKTATRRKDREQLLREFADTKRKLDEMGKDLAFLSIDVVDSTGMKQGEERAIIEHDFREYKRFVERMLSGFGCLKATWTPDGVMACFTTVDAAVRAAREVVNGLDLFNSTVKSMRRNFQVRCGVNSGFVYFDESLPLEELTDRVLDIAAHIQKKAKPNTICVAKPAIEPLNERNGFEPAGTMVDGYELYEWRKV